MTPFLYYACEQRKLLKQAGNKMSLPDQSRKIAGMWATLTDKSQYEELANCDRARYNSEMEQYTPPYKIKRPRSSYAFFMKNNRASVAAKNPAKSPRELMVDIACAWKTLTTEERKHYNDMASNDKVRYAEEKKAEQEKKAE